ALSFSSLSQSPRYTMAMHFDYGGAPMRPGRYILGLFLLSVFLGTVVFLSHKLLTSPVSDRETDTFANAGLFGSVLDGAGPVPGARVRFKDRTDADVTDPLGRFRLDPRLPPDGRITAWKEGYFIAGADATSSPLEL